MLKLRTLGLLAGFIAALAVSAAPASAWWESNGVGSAGTVRVTESGLFSGGSGTGKSEVKCPEEGIEATWSIQSKGEIKIHEKEEKQVKEHSGPHEHINVLKWGSKCRAKIGGAEPPLQAQIKPCELQLVQQKGVFIATAGVVTECRITAGNCTIIIPAGMEKQQGSNEGINVGLSEVKLENVGLNQIAKANVTGIRAEKQVNALCPLTSIQTAELTGLTLEQQGMSAF